ncbi:MAG: radical SAM protein [Candidatus Omnitrophota bacterium]
MIKRDVSDTLEKQDRQGINKKLAVYSKILREKYLLNNKVLLIQPPQFMLDSFNLKVAKGKGCYAYPPAGLQCIANALSKRELDIDILDLNYQLLKRVNNDDSFNYMDWLNILDEYLEKNVPSVIGVTCISIYTDVFSDVHPLTCLLKDLRKKDKSIIIGGGSIITNEYENYLKKELCHFVLEGEGENKVNLLFDYLFGAKKKHKPITGIFFKYDQHIEQTQGEQDIVTLKGNLISTYKDISIEDYNNVGSLNPFSRMAGYDRRFVGIQLNRGCRANCKFCGVVEFMGKGLRQYPIDDLLEEIHYLVKKKGIRHFEILDDDFFGYQTSSNVVIKLLEEMVDLNKQFGISWAAGNGLIAASLTEEILDLMCDSGCVGFRIGIESGNEAMLKRMRKPTTLNLLREKGRMLQKYPELFVGGNYIIGLFGEETFGQMLETFRFANEIDLDWAAFTVFQFTSKATAHSENFKLGEKKMTTDFIPAKDTSDRQIKANDETISGPEIFSMKEDVVPSREQIKQIWFTFNLIANYLNNKNLKLDANPEKFISWVDAVRVVYPDNPYMPLFAGIGHVFLGNRGLAGKCLKETKENLKISRYWNNRFIQFGLTDLITNFSYDAGEVEAILKSIRERYSKWIGQSEFIEPR